MFEFEEENVEPVGENEDLLEHVKEKDTHRKRRIEKEKQKQREEWKQNKPRGKRTSHRRGWDEDHEF